MPEITPSDAIAGVVVVTPDVHGDNRGRFVETFRKEWVPGAAEMVQANRADRAEGALVGLHYHLHQADYWYVPFGRALVVLHDLRASSPTDGTTLTLEIGEHDHRGVYIPPGVAHGFYALTDMTITYLVDHYYDPVDELGVAWDDPELGVTWPTTAPELSGRDAANPKRSEIRAELRPR
jgi:dTDP-4-dehydrorhamnose 3,5-epimerase